MSERDLIPPQFLTRELAELAINTIAKKVLFDFDVELSRRMAHIVVVVPARDHPTDLSREDWIEQHKILPYVLAELSFGRKEKWPHPFDEIARSKALQLWSGRNDSRTDVRPHLLLPGDAPYWGGVYRHGMAVSCSGVQPHYDQMISGMTADALKALAYDAFVRSENGNFLS